MKAPGNTTMERSLEVPPVLRGARGSSLSRVQFASGCILLGLLLGIAVAPWALDHNVVQACAWSSLINIPCAFCGGTRSFAALASGNFIAALFYNPLVALGTVLVFISALVCLCQPRRALLNVKWPLVSLTIGLALGVNWAYLIFYLPR